MWEKAQHFFLSSFFPIQSYYFKSWKTCWRVKDVYKTMTRVERFLCFRGFGQECLLAWNFYGHKGIPMPIYSSKFWRNSPRCDTCIGREGRKLLDWAPSVDAMKWLWVFFAQCIRFGWVTFCCCDLQGSGVGAADGYQRGGFSSSPYMAVFCVLRGEGASSTGTRCGWWDPINPTQKAHCSAERVSNVAL